MKKSIGLLVACLAGLWGATLPATAAVEDSVNADKEPAIATYNGWTTVVVGWEYTPSFSYDLNGIQSRFGAPHGWPVVDINGNPVTPNPFGTGPVPLYEDGAGPHSPVTVEIYDGLPQDGGHLLRSADFIPSHDFSGGSFADLTLTAGTPYFIDFRNVANLAVNVTWDETAARLEPEYVFSNYFGKTQWDVVEWKPLPVVSTNGVLPWDPRYEPILRFLGEPIESPSSAPEPAGVAILGMGVLPLLRRGSGRGRSRSA